jgi:hypothetical protein
MHTYKIPQAEMFYSKSKHESNFSMTILFPLKISLRSTIKEYAH